jgi:tRNA (pseudouridine54-N1)-methyltransferase
MLVREVKRRFVVVAQRALASGEFSLDDIASSGGRIDVPLRCLRAAMLSSHGLRPSVIVYLVLCGGEYAPRTIRFDGASVKFLRPDERALAVLVQKTLAAARAQGRAEAATGAAAAAFAEVKPGISVVSRGVDAVLDDVAGTRLYLVREGADDVRAARELGEHESTFFLGDDRGFDVAVTDELERRGAIALGLGPVSMHAEDAVAVLTNELDRRAFAHYGERGA